MRIGACQYMWRLRLWLQETIASTIREGVAYGMQVLSAGPEEGLEVGTRGLPGCSSSSDRSFLHGRVVMDICCQKPLSALSLVFRA